VNRLFLVLLLAIAAFLVRGADVFVMEVQQDDRARTEALVRSASERLKALTAEADRLAAQARTLLTELRRLEVDRQIKDEELAQAKANEARLAAELEALNRELARLETEQRAELPELRARLVELYKLGQGGYLRLFLSTADTRNLGQASRMVAAIARRDRDRMAAHQRRVDELKAGQTALQARQTELASVRATAERAQAAAIQAIQRQRALIRDIDQRRDLNAQLAGELTATEQRLQATLRDLTPGTASGGAPSAPPFATLRGQLEWPAAGPLRHRFGQTGASAGSSANGIEITTTVGTPVRIVADGTIAFADTFAGYGKLVIVDHGNQVFSLYGHLLDISATRGARVGRGEVAGTAGFALLGVPGLYFELRIDGRPVDPLQWLRKR
jgi:septal ring factor EnvC (AmiA/AmiB activator)